MKPLVEWQTIDGKFISNREIFQVWIHCKRKFFFFKSVSFWVTLTTGKEVEVSKETYESIKRFM